jgi:hypothetical protein
MVQVYKNITSPQVLDQIPILDWLNDIQVGTYKDQIDSLRKLPKNSKDFNIIKNNLPCCTYNFVYNRYKKDSNILGSTGFLFIDVDNQSIDIKECLKSKVFAIYKSVSNNGYHIIVKVSNIPSEIDSISFNEFYKSICNDLNIIDYIDYNAIRRSQFSIVSYDPDLYFNECSFVYEYKNTPTTFANLNTIIEEYIRHSKGGEIRFSNIDEIANVSNGYKVNKEGWHYVECRIAGKSKDGKREIFLSSYCNNLIWLNIHLSQKVVYSIMINVNRVGCVNPMSEKEIYNIVDYKFRNKENIKPIYQKKTRKVVFAKNGDYSIKEKIQIVSKVVGQMRTENKLMELQSIIYDWDFEKYGKISQSKIYNNFKISKNFVEKHYSKFINKKK